MLSTKNLKNCFFEAFTVYHSKLKLSMRNTVQVDSSIKQGDQTDLLNMLSYMRNRGKNDNNPG